MFTIYANDLGLQLTSGIGQFADDTFLYRIIRCPDDVSKLQSNLDSLSIWSTNNSLQLNPTKCKFMSLTRKHSSINSSYNINGTALERVDSLSLLGVTVSNNLRWDLHIKNIVARSNKLLGFIRHVAGECHSDVLLQLYRTMVLPILDYCAPVWSPHNINLKSSLERVQRTATRAILHQRRREQDYDVRLERLGLSYLSNRRDYLSICLIAKCLSTPVCFDSMPSLSSIKVNTRHQEHLKFHHLYARTDALLHNSIHNFPTKWSSLPYTVSDSFLCKSFSNFKTLLRDHFKSFSGTD